MAPVDGFHSDLHHRGHRRLSRHRLDHRLHRQFDAGKPARRPVDLPSHAVPEWRHLSPGHVSAMVAGDHPVRPRHLHGDRHTRHAAAARGHRGQYSAHASFAGDWAGRTFDLFQALPLGKGREDSRLGQAVARGRAHSILIAGFLADARPHRHRQNQSLEPATRPQRHFSDPRRAHLPRRRQRDRERLRISARRQDRRSL